MDDSYSLAEAFVLAALNREFHEQSVAVGDELEVRVSEVDCVPLSVEGDGREWKLRSVRPLFSKLVATYVLDKG